MENDSKNKVGAEAVPKLNKFVASSLILSFLDLRSTNLTDAGLIQLCSGIMGNKTLFHLNLSKNDITQSGIEKFAPILFRTSLTELDLSLNPLGNNGVKVLSDNFSENVPTERKGIFNKGKRSKLVKLNLSETKFFESGGQSLLRNLNQFNQIEHLTLDYNHFGQENMH